MFTMHPEHREVVLILRCDQRVCRHQVWAEFRADMQPKPGVVFQVQTAHGILSNPELRAKYDAGGLGALDEAALQQHGLQVLCCTSQ
jgi:hypothetical protein